MEFTDDVCYRALCARDARFDGLFFVGVTTTGIYCRPVCAARTPGRDRCRFFEVASAAEQAGFRPCLRCRPELAPGFSPVDATARVARAAAARIDDGALDNGRNLDDLAAEFGLSSRQLRRVVLKELGVVPVKLAQTHRLLLAKQLLTDTPLSATQIAFASGFKSVRRFNALFSSHYRMAPSRIRKARPVGANRDAPLRLRLAYRPPFAWRELLEFTAARAISGVECSYAGAYARTAAIGRYCGWLRVTHDAEHRALNVEFSQSLTPALPVLLARLRRMFDLGARPDVIVGHLKGDAHIGPAVRRCPGLRVPGAFDGFELAWRAILGQNISVRAATTLAGRLAERFGEAWEGPIGQIGPIGFIELSRLSPTAERFASAAPRELAGLGIHPGRAASIVGLAREVAAGRLRLEAGGNPAAVVAQLKSLPGIGEWTAQYIAMRALGWPDAFPQGDLGLLRGMGAANAADLNAIAERWRPWRAYGAMHVWNKPELFHRGDAEARSTARRTERESDELLRHV